MKEAKNTDTKKEPLTRFLFELLALSSGFLNGGIRRGRVTSSRFVQLCLRAACARVAGIPAVGCERIVQRTRVERAAFRSGRFVHNVRAVAVEVIADASIENGQVKQTEIP